MGERMLSVLLTGHHTYVCTVHLCHQVTTNCWACGLNTEILNIHPSSFFVFGGCFHYLVATRCVSSVGFFFFGTREKSLFEYSNVKYSFEHSAHTHAPTFVFTLCIFASNKRICSVRDLFLVVWGTVEHLFLFEFFFFL